MTEKTKIDTAGKGADAADPELMRKLTRLRAALRENFGMAILALMHLPRYNTQSLADLQHLILDPMLNDRIAFAYPGKNPQDADTAGRPEGVQDTAGLAIWASVSEEVDNTIREQIKQGVFPIRLKAGDWNSGKINWLLDVVTPNKQMTAAVIGNFRQVAKEGELRLHPLISRLVDPELLEKMGARRSPEEAAAAAQQAEKPKGATSKAKQVKH